MIYNVELVDQNINEVAFDPSSSLKAEFNSDLLDGVMAIKGTWADGSPLLAIPNYARLNRGDGPQNADNQENAGAGGRRGRGGFRRTSSVVWMLEKQL